ncbi:MAG: hypothetical protein ABEJ59_00995 [Halanaeroarchaeum sp.]
MTYVTDDATGDERPHDVPELPADPDPAETIEAYRTSDDGVVLYDADNPLAWVKSTAAVPIGDQR